MSRVILSASAKRDLAEIVAFVGQASPRAARRLAQTLKDAAFTLGDAALHYPVALTLEQREIRRRVVGSYNIYYQLTGDRIDILRVLHAARDRDALIDES